MRLATLLVAILLTLPTQLQAGSAGCETASSSEVASQQAGTVFVGSARSVSPTSDDVTFDVDWQWKGNPMPAVVKVSVYDTSDLVASGASRTFATGRKYLVFTINSFAPFIVDACAPHQSFVADGSAIPPNLWEALGNSTPTLPEPVTNDATITQPPSWTSLGAAALGAVLLLLMIRGLLQWRSRRKSAGPKPFKMKRRVKTWLAEQEELENTKPSFGDRELEKQRKVWAKKHRKQRKAAAAAVEAADKQRASADA